MEIGYDIRNPSNGKCSLEDKTKYYNSTGEEY